MRAGHGLSMLLIVVLAVVAGALSQHWRVSADWTYGGRNTLTPASDRVLAALDHGPVRFKAFIYPGAQRERLRTRLARYTRASGNVRLEFVDPARHPRQVRRLGIGRDGALQIRYRDRTQMVTDYDEASVTQALQRLSTAGEQWVVFVAGHGERAVGDKTSGGYSQLAAALDAQGMRTRRLDLAATAAIPDNTAALVIASPQQDLLPGELRLINDYVAAGGALLWADDPGPRHGLGALSDQLGVRRLDGTLIYPDYKRLGTRNAAMAVVASYPDTPITERLNRLSLLPFAGALGVDADSGWNASVFLRSSTRSWLETGAIHEGSISYQSDQGDRPGPLPLGVALTRPIAAADDRSADTQQRVAVVADSDFLANAHLSRYGNRPLALAIFQWLTHRDAQIAVDVATAPDATLQMRPARIRQLAWLFAAVLPVVLLSVGLTRWWRRRR